MPLPIPYVVLIQNNAISSLSSKNSAGSSKVNSPCWIATMFCARENQLKRLKYLIEPLILKGSFYILLLMFRTYI